MSVSLGSSGECSAAGTAVPRAVAHGAHGSACVHGSCVAASGASCNRTVPHSTTPRSGLQGMRLANLGCPPPCVHPCPSYQALDCGTDAEAEVDEDALDSAAPEDFAWRCSEELGGVGPRTGRRFPVRVLSENMAIGSRGFGSIPSPRLGYFFIALHISSVRGMCNHA